MTNALATDVMGVEELDTMSLVETGGGDWRVDAGKALLNCIMNNWTEFKAGFSEGANNPI